MRLRFKQRFFSWLDSYDVYDEAGEVMFTVEGKFAFGHCLHILNAAGAHIGTVQQKVFTVLPQFDLYLGEQYVGCIRKAFSFFGPGSISTATAGKSTGTGWSGTTPFLKVAAMWWRR